MKYIAGKGVDGIISQKNMMCTSANNMIILDKNIGNKLDDSIKFRKSYEQYISEFNRDKQRIDQRCLFVKRMISDSLQIKIFEQYGEQEKNVVYILDQYLTKECSGKTDWDLNREWFTLFSSPEYNRNDFKISELRNAIHAYQMLNLLRLR